jgi:hypothetical protein
MDIGVLEEDFSSEWDSLSPSFAFNKKNGTILVVTDFKKNKTQLIVETYNVTHFLFQRLGKLTRSIQWKGLPLLQHWT